MGSLLDLADFRGDARANHSRLRNPYWHFVDSRYDRSGVFDHTLTYPHVLYVHIDLIDGYRWREESEHEAALFRIAVRRWIEANIAGDVIYHRVSMTYTRVYPMNPKRPNDRERPHSEYPHGYYEFYFENQPDAVGFRMRFPEVVTKTLPYRPDHPPGPDDVDFVDRWKADRLIKGY